MLSSSQLTSSDDESEVSCYEDSSVTSDSTDRTETSSLAIRQTHHGLFCLTWTLEFFSDDQSFCKEFKVSASDINQSYAISCFPKKFFIEGGPRRRKIAQWSLRLVLKHLLTAFKGISEDRAQELLPIGGEQRLVHFWQTRDGENEDKNGEFDSGLWTLRTFNVKKLPTVVTLWMDFGSSTVGERGFKTGENTQVLHSFWLMDEKLTSLISGLIQLLKKEILCDVQFNFKNGEIIRAHVAILMAGSPVFATMFQSSAPVQESNIKKIDLDDVDFTAFFYLLNYLYSGDVPKLNNNEAIQLLYEAADKFGVMALKYECSEMMLARIKISNAIKLLIWSDKRSIPKVSEAVMKYISLNGSEICTQSEWMDLMKDNPALCLNATRSMICYAPKESSSKPEDNIE